MTPKRKKTKAIIKNAGKKEIKKGNKKGGKTKDKKRGKSAKIGNTMPGIEAKNKRSFGIKIKKITERKKDSGKKEDKTSKKRRNYKFIFPHFIF